MARTPARPPESAITDDNLAVELPTSDLRARLPLIIIIAFTLISCGAVVYNAFAPVTEEKLDDKARSVASTACRATYDNLKTLPVLTSVESVDRAKRLEQENTIFERLAVTLATARPTDRVGGEAYRAWVRDWHGVNKARSAYAVALRASPDFPELLLPKDGSAPITNRMNKYSRTHNLIVCATHNLQAEIVDGKRNYPNDPTKVP